MKPGFVECLEAVAVCVDRRLVGGDRPLELAILGLGALPSGDLGLESRDVRDHGPGPDLREQRLRGREPAGRILLPRGDPPEAIGDVVEGRLCRGCLGLRRPRGRDLGGGLDLTLLQACSARLVGTLVDLEVMIAPACVLEPALELRPAG